MTHKWIPPNIDDLVESYRAGRSVNDLSGQHGVSRGAVGRALMRAGVALRGPSDAETLKWSDMDAAARQRQVGRAHEAVRGSVQTEDHRRKIAGTKQGDERLQSGLEQVFDAMLKARGLQCIPQQAIGRYNCDFGAAPVAVEVFGGNWHFSGRHLARLEQRTRYILDAGWHIFVVASMSGEGLLPDAADQAVAFVERARADPSLVRQYRMIGGRGQFMTGGSADDDHISLIPTLGRRRDPASGRYEASRW